MSAKISRRDFLKGAGLTLAVVATPFGYQILSAAEAAGKSAEGFAPNVWLKITADGTVTAVVNKSEMGQGVYTSLPMIIADELEADWRMVRFESAPAGDAYKDPVWQAQATGGSSSVRHMTEPLRKAGATAREMLVTAAAKGWKVPAGECVAEKGAVLHRKSGRKIAYGKLVAVAARLPVPTDPPLKKAERFRLRGKPLPRLDVQEKVDGTARFGIDVFVPGMLYAAIARPPAYGAKPVAIDREAALKSPGVRQVLDVKDGIAVLADSLHEARKGRTVLAIRWDGGAHPDLDTVKLEGMFREALAKPGIVAKEQGNAADILGKSARRLEATYLLPYLSHATIEPMNCTVQIEGERCQVWAPTQNQTGVHQLAAKVSGLPPEQVTVHTTYLGGGFGRRFELDFAEEALLLAKGSGRPVKLIWSREEDLQNDFYRPGNSCTIAGGLDAEGKLTAWSHRVVCPSIFARVFPNMMEKGIDPAAVEGIENMEYEVPNLFVEYVRLDTPVPVGFWRSVGSSHNAFTVECFMDELARAAGKDPVEFRLRLLANHPHAAGVIRTAAEKAGWGKPLPPGRGRGIAYHLSFESHIAQVAEVSVDKGTGKVRVHRVVCAVDCGPVINPAIVKAQMAGGILFGLSAALKEKIELKNGGIASENFGDYDLLRIDEAPEIEVHIVKGKEKLGGIGEPGVPPIAPAVANALFAAAGARLRTLPLTPEAVLKALKEA